MSDVGKLIKCKCIVCGKEFESIRKSTRYCSYECNQADYRKKHRGAMRTVKCLYCGKEFVTTRQTKVYCSEECCQRFHRGRNNYTYHCKCEVCGKEFEANYPNKKCCSKECSLKLMSMRHKKKRISRKTTAEEIAQEYERMKKNGVPVTSRKVDGMGVVIESRGQHCWSCGPSIARSIY